MAKVLVTGSSGYIASWLVPRLREAGLCTVGVDKVRSSVKLDEFVEGDLNDPTVARSALSDGVEAVFHLAAAKGDWGIRDDEYHRDNVEATRVLLDQGSRSRVKKWIFFSTVATHGPSDKQLNEDAPFNPTITYGKTKVMAERMFEQYYSDDHNVRIAIVRPSVVFGPGHPANTNIYRLIDAIMRNRFIMIGKGQHIKTTSYIENLIEATVFLFEKNMPGISRYIYVDHPQWSVSRLVKAIYHELGKKPSKVSIPLWSIEKLALCGDVIASFTGLDIPITSARIRKFCTGTNFDASAIREMGFKQPVPIETAVSKTVRWHKECVAHVSAMPLYLERSQSKTKGVN